MREVSSSLCPAAEIFSGEEISDVTLDNAALNALEGSADLPACLRRGCQLKIGELAGLVEQPSDEREYPQSVACRPA